MGPMSHVWGQPDNFPRMIVEGMDGSNLLNRHSFSTLIGSIYPTGFSYDRWDIHEFNVIMLVIDGYAY